MTGDLVPLVGRRATINFIQPAAISLDWLVGRTGMKQVDVVNRAVQIYAAIEAQLVEGKKLVLVAPDGSSETLRIV